MSLTNVINRRYQLHAPAGVPISAGCYVATDLVTRESVAVKLAPLGDPAANQLEREEQVLKGIRHPSIIQTYEAGRSLDRKQFVVYEHLKGRSLASEVKQNGVFTAERLIGIIDQLASAIDAAHAQNIIHGAVCPDHVIVYQDQVGVERCKLAEFGYAFDSKDAARVANDPYGHPAPEFMSPEQAQGRPATPSTDIYSLAAVIFFAWAGKPPFAGADALAIAAATANGSPPRISERARHLQLPPVIDAALALALDRQVEQRPRSAMELADAIRNAFVKQPGGVEGLVAAAQGHTPRKRVSARTTVPTAVIRPAGGRVTPAAAGEAAFAPVAQSGPLKPPEQGPLPASRIGNKPSVMPSPAKGVSFAEVRLVTLSVLLTIGLLWLSFKLG